MIARGDAQVNHQLMVDRDENGTPFATAEQIRNIPPKAEIAPDAPQPNSSAWTSGLIGPTLVPYQHVGRFKREWVESATLHSGVRLEGALWLGGSFHIDGENTHDLLLTVQLDYQQIDFALGSKVARAHVVRVPRDGVLIYDFSLPTALPEGEHVLSIAVNWDPWTIYTTRAIRTVFAKQGKQTWSAAGPLKFDHLNIANKYLRVGKGGPPHLSLQSVPDPKPIPVEPGGSLIMSRGSTFDDQVWRRQQALGTDEPNRLYAYVNYAPSADIAEVQRTQVVLTLFMDDHQIPIMGQRAFFWEVEAGKQYRIPINLDLPKDGRVHTLNASLSVMPFLPSKYFDEPRPSWMQFDAYEATVFPIVPSRSWIPWLPEID